MSRHTMKLGFVGFIYTPPKEITDDLEGFLWQVEKSAELGCSVFHGHYPSDEKSLEIVKAKIDELGIELEGRAPREVFELTGPNLAEARKAIEREIEIAKYLGCSVMRNGYGRLTTETSRYSTSIPLQEHLQFLTDNLKEASRIFADAGIYYGIENHCDFTGREFARIFTEVDSPYVGSALDTANGFTVFCDPNDDVEALAPFAVTTHIKDMKVVDHKSDLVMFQARGCALGEGHVDIPRAIELLEKHAPRPEGLHLIIEQGWMEYAPDRDRAQQDKEALERGLAYLKRLVA